MRKLASIVPSMIVIFALCVVVACEEVTQMSLMEKEEQEALYSSMRSLVGKWFNGSDMFPDPCGRTPITGVSCDLVDGLWHITALAIGPVLNNAYPCATDAKFNPLLFQLKHLRSLSFFRCFQNPIVIDGLHWENFSNSLRTLDFKFNPGLRGEFPASICSLTNLQSLVIIENKFSGALPATLGNLMEMKRLVLSGNRFSGGLPSGLGHLRKLLILDLSGNSFSGLLPSTVDGLTSLLKLDLSNNALGGKLPSEMGQLKSLTLLDLRNNQFCDGLSQSLQGMVSLEVFLLSSNRVRGTLMEFNWKSLHNLVVLDFSSMDLVGRIPEALTQLKTLRFLALHDNHLSGNVPSSLGRMPCLKGLYLNGNNLTGELAFSEAFYWRMGRHFAAWSNPHLCYNGGVVRKENAPAGVKECQQHMPISLAGWRRVVGGEDASDIHESSSAIRHMGHCLLLYVLIVLVPSLPSCW